MMGQLQTFDCSAAQPYAHTMLCAGVLLDIVLIVHHG